MLSLITRDLPADCDPSKPCEPKWNQDRVWFSKAEARQWLPRDPKPGDNHRLPQELVFRLARLHLVDTVNGQTSPFSPGQVRARKSRPRCGTPGRSREGQDYGNHQRGCARAQAGGSPPTASKPASWDTPSTTWIRKRSSNSRWWPLGRGGVYTELNGRRRDAESGPVGFVIRAGAGRRASHRPGFHPRL